MVAGMDNHRAYTEAVLQLGCHWVQALFCQLPDCTTSGFLKNAHWLAEHPVQQLGHGRLKEPSVHDRSEYTHQMMCPNLQPNVVKLPRPTLATINALIWITGVASKWVLLAEELYKATVAMVNCGLCFV